MVVNEEIRLEREFFISNKNNGIDRKVLMVDSGDAVLLSEVGCLTQRCRTLARTKAELTEWYRGKLC